MDEGRMKLGLLTAPFPDTDLMAVADWTASAGMSMLEIACWPAGGGETRRYAGTSHIDVDGLSEGEAGEIVAALDEKGIGISGLGYYPNPLHADAAHRDEVIGHLKKVINAAGKMRVPVVNTFIRSGEVEADLYGLQSAREPDGFAEVALKLGEYRKLAPGPLEEWVFFDHPSGRNRIRMAMRWKAEELRRAQRAGTPSPSASAAK
jgi:sugar phosphate isomerase/epimerase